MLSNHLTLCHPLFLLPSIFPGSRSFPMIRLFISGGQSIGASTSASSPSNEYSRLISFGINWFDLLAVQGALNSLLQHHNAKASVLWCSVFFMVQLSHLYMTTEKAIALTLQSFVSKVMSLLFNMLSRLITTFLPRSSSVQLLSHVQPLTHGPVRLLCPWDFQARILEWVAIFSSRGSIQDYWKNYSFD